MTGLFYSTKDLHGTQLGQESQLVGGKSIDYMWCFSVLLLVLIRSLEHTV